MKAARTFDAVRHARDANVRDELRARDAPAVSEAVLAIVADGEARLVDLRKDPSLSQDKSQLEDLVGLAMKAFASIVRASSTILANSPVF